MARKGNFTQNPPTLAAILERLENTRRLVQLSVHHSERALSEATEAASAMKELEGELDLLVRGSGKAGGQ